MKYDSSLTAISLETAAHYSERMYRTTGDTAYLLFIRPYLCSLVTALRHDINNLNDLEYWAQRETELLKGIDSDGRKGRQRRELFDKENRCCILFNLNLLSMTQKLAGYKIDDTEVVTLLGRASDYLKSVPFDSILLDKKIVRVYAAQAVNYVYYLKDLGLGDFRERYRQIFRETFPDSED